MDSIKQLILESAEVKFLQHNYDDVFLTEICRDAGITTGAFYRRFSEKRELIRVIVDLAMSDLKDGIKEYQAKRNEQFSKERMGENWLSILVYQHRNGFQIMLRHAPAMEKTLIWKKQLRFSRTLMVSKRTDLLILLLRRISWRLLKHFIL